MTGRTTCPKCGRDYTASTYSYCLDDGTLLAMTSEPGIIIEAETETLLSLGTRMDIADASVRRRELKPRALKEETGITGDTPIRAKRESASYWNTRLLTHDLLGMHYRTPQLNLYLLEDYINSRTFGKFFIKSSMYVAGGDRNLRFETLSGPIAFDAHTPIDPDRFLARFALER